MEKDAAPSGCDVIGCDEPATGSYLHARDTRLLEFGICIGHHARLQNGERPLVIAEPTALRGSTSSRPALVLQRQE